LSVRCRRRQWAVGPLFRIVVTGPDYQICGTEQERESTRRTSRRGPIWMQNSRVLVSAISRWAKAVSGTPALMK
jgi:hypothetical protein